MRQVSVRHRSMSHSNSKQFDWYISFVITFYLNSYSNMEELDVPQMRREVESLQYQLAINREKSSITVTE